MASPAAHKAGEPSPGLRETTCSLQVHWDMSDNPEQPLTLLPSVKPLPRFSFLFGGKLKKGRETEIWNLQRLLPGSSGRAGRSRAFARGCERNPSISGTPTTKEGIRGHRPLRGLVSESCSLEAVLQLLAAHLLKGTLYSFLSSRFSCSVSKTRFSFAATSGSALDFRGHLTKQPG